MYRIIYADPPWQYTSGAKRGAAANHYGTTETTKLADLDVQSIAAKDSVLLMWATWPCLKDAFELFDAWGFKYTTCAFVWAKQNKRNDDFFVGLGHHTRGNTEFCLLGKRGKGVPVLDRSVRQLQVHRRGEHSAKPEAIRHEIERLYGINEENDLPRLEMFARYPVDGWHVFGNEAPESIHIPLKTEVA